jgi:RNA polymerase sigma factor (sigma-70 family)
MLNWIRRRLGSDEDPEDLMQEVFARAARVLNAAKPVDNLVSWLYAAARNAIVDTWRQREKRPVAANAEDLDATVENLLAESVLPGPDEALLRCMALEAFEEALDDLPEQQRDVFLLQAVDGYTFREIAELLDISPNTAMSRKRYAVARLRERLADFKDATRGG